MGIILIPLDLAQAGEENGVVFIDIGLSHSAFRWNFYNEGIAYSADIQ